MKPGPDRIATLDLVRGVAVLGILAVNIASFAGPALSSLTPNYPAPASALSQWTFGAVLLLFEGKMRALFTMLFGASMLLFIERAEARGSDGALLQVRRLSWLLLLGYLHFLLLWPGDILFLYALVGLILLGFRDMETEQLLGGALAFYLLWHLGGGLVALSPLAPDPQATARLLDVRAREEIAVMQGGYGAMIAHRLAVDWHLPLSLSLSSLGETAPLMAIGMVLYRTGFFTGAWPRRRLTSLALLGTGSGALLTLAFLAWAQPRGFPSPTMLDYLQYWSGPAHLLMALGYASLLMLCAPRLTRTWPGRRLVAAGRMAFSNYIVTSLVMCLLFNGWGLRLALRFDAFELLAFVAFGWALMLLWSAPWLARFRQGPLEWLWRSLTERRFLPFR